MCDIGLDIGDALFRLHHHNLDFYMRPLNSDLT